MPPVAWRVCFLLDILRETQEIERELGRMKKSAGGNYSDRLIDIDILLYGDLILHTPELEIPHPLMTERRFVMDRWRRLHRMWCIRYWEKGWGSFKPVRVY